MNDNSALDYRLSNIEKTLSEVKDAVVTSKLQAQTIETIQNNMAEFLNAINAHDKRLRNLEMQPVKEKANRWQQTCDYILKLVLAAAITVILAKVGLNG